MSNSPSHFRQEITGPPALPLEDLERFTPCYAQVVKSLADHAQTSVDLAHCCLLGAASAACQHLYNVPVPWQRRGTPLSGFYFCEVPSGSFKSSVFTHAFEGVKEGEKAMKKQYLVERANYRKNLDATPPGQPKPEEPKLDRRLLGNATAEAIVKALRFWGVITLAMDEAGSHTTSWSAQRVQKGAHDSTMNSAWDGGPLNRMRTSDGGTDHNLTSLRFSMMLLSQDERLSSWCLDEGSLSNGFAQRALIVHLDAPDEIITTLPPQTIPPALEAFQEATRSLRLKPIKFDSAEEVETSVMPHEDGAMELIHGFSVEARREALGRDGHLRSRASREAELVARLAGVLAVVEHTLAGYEGRPGLSLNALNAALALMRSYYREHWNRLVEIGTADESADLAQKCSDFIKEQTIKLLAGEKCARYIKRSKESVFVQLHDLFNRIRSLRGKDAIRDEVKHLLLDREHLFESKKGKVWFEVNPEILNDSLALKASSSAPRKDCPACGELTPSGYDSERGFVLSCAKCGEPRHSK